MVRIEEYRLLGCCANVSLERIASNFRVTRISELGTTQRMVSSGMLRRVALVRTDISEERLASNFRVTRISELGTTQLAANVVSNSLILVILIIEAIHSSETSNLTRSTA
jgi:hypothetical protein